MNINSLVKEYLINSYLYYEENVTLISDSEFDYICKSLLDNFDKIEHMHKNLIDIESLRSNTGYTIEYPNIIKDLAIERFKSIKGYYPYEEN